MYRVLFVGAFWPIRQFKGLGSLYALLRPPGLYERITSRRQLRRITPSSLRNHRPWLPVERTERKRVDCSPKRRFAFSSRWSGLCQQFHCGKEGWAQGSLAWFDTSSLDPNTRRWYPQYSSIFLGLEFAWCLFFPNIQNIRTAGHNLVRLNMQTKDGPTDVAVLSLSCRPQHHINLQMVMNRR